MARDRSFQRNAGDQKQVAFAERKAKQAENRYRSALANVMRTAEGRVVMSTLIRRAGVFRTIWDPSAKIHFNAGRQDYGLELLADVTDADEAMYQLMERETRAYDRGIDAEAEAVQTPSAQQGDETND